MATLSLMLGALLVVLISALWKKVIVDLIWRPYAITKAFRKQGVGGPPYKFLKGSLEEIKSISDASRELVLDKSSHEITLKVLPHYRKWVKEYGSTFLFWFGAQPRICITDLEMIKQVLSNKSGFYPKLDASLDLVAILGRGLVLAEGEEWVRHRRIVNPAFTMDKLKMLIKEMVECTKVMVEHWHDQIIQADNQQKEMEVGWQIEELTADVISHTAFGSSYMEGKEVFLAQKELQNHAAQSIFTLDVPGFRYLPTKRNRQKWMLQRKVRNMLVNIIQRRLDLESSIYGNDLLGLMMEASQKEGKQKLSMDEIIDECKTFFFAGQETTSHLITWTMFLLSTNQDWQEKLRDEVLRECAMEVPNADTLSKLKLVTMVLLEALRLYSPVFFLGRKAAKDITLGNIKIPKGAALTIPVLVVHRSEEVWGADANEFNPNRFENGISKAARHPNAMLGFAIGPRACIGQNFAMLEGKTVIAMILQRFSFSLSPNYKHVPAAIVTMQPQYGVPIVFRPLQA